jgi:uncharacterized protein (DUF2384 family)
MSFDAAVLPLTLEAFKKIMRAWQAPGREFRQLLGLAPGTNIEKLDTLTLSDEQITRITYVMDVSEAMVLYMGDEMAVHWVGQRNTNALFAGRSPLEYMARGGLDAMRNVRKLLDTEKVKQLARTIYGDHAEEWMQKPLKQLNGKSPLEALGEPGGADRVEWILIQIDHRHLQGPAHRLQ